MKSRRLFSVHGRIIQIKLAVQNSVSVGFSVRCWFDQFIGLRKIDTAILHRIFTVCASNERAPKNRGINHVVARVDRFSRIYSSKKTIPPRFIKRFHSPTSTGGAGVTASHATQPGFPVNHATGVPSGRVSTNRTQCGPEVMGPPTIEW